MVQRQNLEAIFDSVTDGILAADLQLRIINLNRAASELVGIGRLRAVGSSCLDVLQLNAEADTLGRALSEHREVSGLSFTLDIRDDDPRQLLATTRVLRDDDGQSHGIVLVLRDVTELEAMRDQLVSRRGIQGIIGRNRGMQEIYDLVEQLADSDATVLVLGESGTGKELVAAAVHHGSERRDGPFVKVNCAALSESLLESELFGHVKGSFTGAVRDKVGRFELADGGTVFLDEIGDLSPQVQVKLLRVLQEREIERVGGTETIAVDCRIIAATNQDLLQAIAAGGFREDLYYRLNVMPIEVPPLRQRRDDIPLLVDHFVDLFRTRTGRPIRYVDDEALQLLTNYSWPGNVRELENAIEHAFIRCRGEVILARCLPPQLSLPATPAAETLETPTTEPDRDEKAAVLRALEETRWNRREAALRLDMHRTTLWRKMREFGLG
ncbi:MAG: sigma 54-interacting transcriptional regulator [Gemmatimonadetes bacterium]|nr:sigma 54-interacting transcriptional regulator [Gemmatimonadota bacterium]MBT5145816.1 sigma 54-interacting transcriptional regulator [Gemmatimonadota bacterium]MBT5587797.1 sigma 54-interacting transcriptional regulator [Gemmatimonadota bacterium]MBT5962391.1 sigma 54-interacting transcriptional regulator [Gemmatimonadota bacterium]MBT7456332.1 sigma 54-interacting transcriptional regulator [Gemmatimonadota bacterium]